MNVQQTNKKRTDIFLLNYQFIFYHFHFMSKLLFY